MGTINDQLDSLGEVVDQVELQVDYQIIEHFSEHLYDSPNKAVEELVANGFDAFATEVEVFTPGPHTNDRVLVLDNGHSMDIEGLKKLWWIAKSPKTDERIATHQGRERKLIGKFGIGKLASYSVGNMISHLCRHGPQFYLVCVDYQKIHVPQDGHITAPVVQLTDDRARDLLSSLLTTQPTSTQRIFDAESWTLAIIEDLKVQDLRPGRLTWVLGNGMPLNPDFSIRVNGEIVESKLAKEAVIKWDFGTDRVVDAIRSRWDELSRSDDGTAHESVSVGSEPIQFGAQAGLDPSHPEEETPYVLLPTIGKVWGRIRLFDDTLLKYRSVDSGRSHGFFLMVRGRLTNPDDDKLYIPDPSFQSFFRSQFVIHADGLDDALLADRQRLRIGTGVRELEILQRILMGIARVTIEARDEASEEEENAKSALPIRSRTYYRGPLNALALHAPIEQVADFDPLHVAVERKPLGEEDAISVINFPDKALQVNSSHPYYAVLEQRAGRSRAGRELLRTVDLFAVAERLLEGHLLETGFEFDEVAAVMEWRDGLFRGLAKSYEEAPQVVQEMWRLSYPGGRAFELAVAKVFEDMGFKARHAGGANEEDVLVMATVGPESYSFVVEAKGSRGPVNNDAAEVSGAARHRDSAQVENAVIVAREFMGLDRLGDQSAVYQECASTGGVALMTVDVIERIHGAVTRFSYPLALIEDIVITLESLEQKLVKVKALEEPETGFDFGALLDQIWERQQGEAAESVVPYRAVYQQAGWREHFEFADFERRLIALETFAAGRIQVNQQSEVVHLRQAPELIQQQIERALHGMGTDVGQQDASHENV